MKKLSYSLFIVVFAAILTATPARAQQSNLPKNTLDDWTFGEALVGESVDTKNLNGQVVIIEYWGVN